MKNCANLIRILAIVIFGVLCVTTIVTYVTGSMVIDERIEELEEDIEEHEDEYYANGRYHGDCWECESFESTEKAIERASVTLVVESIIDIAMALILCGIMFAVGEISGKMDSLHQKKQHQDQNITMNGATTNFVPNGAVKNENVYRANTLNCPRCGNMLQAGSNICSNCGATIYRQ